MKLLWFIPAALSGVGLLHSLMGLLWVKRCARLYKTRCSEPWWTEIQADQITERRQEAYCRFGAFLNREMSRQSPLYWLRHWHDELWVERFEVAEQIKQEAER